MLYRDDIEDVRTMLRIYRVTCSQDETIVLGFEPKRSSQEDGSELVEWFDTRRSQSVSLGQSSDGIRRRHSPSL